MIDQTNHNKRILVVEDNLIFREAAISYLEGLPNVAVETARDFHEAIPKLETQNRVNGAIFDCFFPFKTGSGDRVLGTQIIEDLASNDKGEQDYQESLRRIGEYVDLTDPELGPNLRKYFLSGNIGPDSPLVKSLEQVGRVLGKSGATQIAKNTFVNTMGGMIQSMAEPKDYFGDLRKAVEKDEANQPLGIELGSVAENLGIPFILATSTYHHDSLTQPIQNYAGKKGWTLVDCGALQSEEKATPGFWNRAYDALTRRMEDRR